MPSSAARAVVAQLKPDPHRRSETAAALQPLHAAPAASVAPPLPVAQPYLPPADRILPYLERIDQARWYSNFGPLVQALEARLAERFARPTGVVTLSSGTQALTLALRAITGDSGGYCAIPSWTFVATAHAAVQAGLKPWFLDVDETTWMLDPAAVRAALRSAPGPVAAVVLVCPFGRMPPLEPWKAFRRDTGTPVLLDAAAAFDSLDDAELPAAVSLHATKIMGCGEGGFVATEDPQLVERIRRLGAFGFQGGRNAIVTATNAKLSEYGAAVGHASLDSWPSMRLRYMLSSQRLRIALTHATQVEFQPGWGVDWISTSCVLRLPAGAAASVAAALDAEGIGTRGWWGQGCHRQPAFQDCARTAVPATARLAGSTLGTPFAIDMSHEEISRIAAALSAALLGFGVRPQGG